MKIGKTTHRGVSYELDAEFSPPTPIVSAVECQGRMFVATTERVYELVDGLFHPMMFVINATQENQK
jgi:hypothetical protein